MGQDKAYSMIKQLNKSENVNTDTLVKICTALNCRIEDIMEIIPEEKH